MPGVCHFGLPVLEYFPWNSYGDINLLPTIDDKIFLMFSYLGQTVWLSSNNYYYNIWNYKDGYDFSRRHQINFSPSEKLIYFNEIEVSSTSWEDVERMRLIFSMGSKRLVSDYLEYLKFYYDIDEYLRYFFDIINVNSNIFFGPFSVEENNVSSEMVINFLKGYDGGDRFLSSVKSYLYKNDRISEKQEAVVGNLMKKYGKNKVIKKALKIGKGLEKSEYSSDLGSLCNRILRKGYKLCEDYDFYNFYI